LNRNIDILKKSLLRIKKDPSFSKLLKDIDEDED
jgi:hypothetical protein